MLDGTYRRSYVLWKELIPPLLILEYVSGDGSEERDRTPEHGKFWVYEQAIKAPYYGIYEVDPGRVELYHREGGFYRPVPANERGHYPIPEMRVELGIWVGKFYDLTFPWLRFWDAKGNLLLADCERAEQERRRTESQQQRADAWRNGYDPWASIRRASEAAKTLRIVSRESEPAALARVVAPLLTLRARSGRSRTNRGNRAMPTTPVEEAGSQTTQEKHPSGLSVLFLTEMWERFSFYLMIGILPFYLTDRSKGGMGWLDEEMAVVVGSYMGLVYFTPFLGGLLADRLLGCRKTILIGATLMMIGHLVLAWPGKLGLFLGLGFLILGNGAFKPNISTLLGNLYPPGSPLKDTGYNIFYMGINIGAFICNFVAALVRNYFDAHPWQITSGWTLTGWHAAFATAAVGMFIGLVTFGSSFRRFAHADQKPSPPEGAASAESFVPLFVQCLLPAVFLAVIGWLVADNFVQYFPEGLKPPNVAFLAACMPVIFFYLRMWRGVPDLTDRARVAGLLTIMAIAIVFWVTYGLNTTALNVWTRDNTNRELTAPVRLITDRIPEFAENAGPEYYSNSTPEMPRPAPATYKIVSQERYKELKKANELSVREGERVPVTREMFEKVYAKADPNGPRLDEGKHLRLVNPELFQSINPGLIIIFTPLVVALWHFLRGRGHEPSTPVKIGLGLLLVALSPLVMLGAALVSHDGTTKASAAWLFGTYGAVGIGELFLSSMGLSLVNKMAPSTLRASMMGGWFLSTALGLKISGMFGELYARARTELHHVMFWTVLIGVDVAAAILVFVLLPWLNRQMAAEQHQVASKAVGSRQ